MFDWGFALTVGAILVTFGLEPAHSQTGLKYGAPAGLYVIFGSLALLAAAGGVRMLLRGGVFGTQRLVRHLWRMCFALFFATGSFFLGEQQVFPRFLTQNKRTFYPGFPAAAIADFLAIPSSLHKCITRECRCRAGAMFTRSFPNNARALSEAAHSQER